MVTTTENQYATKRPVCALCKQESGLLVDSGSGRLIHEDGDCGSYEPLPPDPTYAQECAACGRRVISGVTPAIVWDPKAKQFLHADPPGCFPNRQAVQ